MQWASDGNDDRGRILSHVEIATTHILQYSKVEKWRSRVVFRCYC